MPSYYGALWSTLKGVVAANWTDVPANRIYRVQELVRINLSRVAPELPCAAIDVNLGEGDWSADTPAEEGAVTFYYVAAVDASPSQIDTKLQALQTYLFDTDLAAGQVLGTPTVSQSLSLPLNQYFANTAKPFWSGAVTARIVIHEA